MTRTEDQPLVVLCTVPDSEVGARLARGLVEGRLAACVNIIPGLRSFYTWQGKVEDDAEAQLLIKTRGQRYPMLERWLRENHPYDEPEVLALPIAHGSRSYLDWLREQTHED